MANPATTSGELVSLGRVEGTFLSISLAGRALLRLFVRPRDVSRRRPDWGSPSLDVFVETNRCYDCRLLW